MTLKKFLEPMKERDARVVDADAAVAALGLPMNDLSGSSAEREAYQDRRVLIAKCEELADLLRDARDNLRTNIWFRDVRTVLGEE